MKRLSCINLFGVMFLVLFSLMCIQACGVFDNGKLKTWTEMNPKEKLVVAYSAYNSQFDSYMADTGFVKQADDSWKKTSDPELTETQKVNLRKRKAVLEEMWPIIQIYNSMTVGKVPYSEKTEQELSELIDKIAGLVPD